MSKIAIIAAMEREIAPLGARLAAQYAPVRRKKVHVL